MDSQLLIGLLETYGLTHLQPGVHKDFWCCWCSNSNYWAVSRDVDGCSESNEKSDCSMRWSYCRSSWCCRIKVYKDKRSIQYPSSAFWALTIGDGTCWVVKNPCHHRQYMATVISSIVIAPNLPIFSALCVSEFSTHSLSTLTYTFSPLFFLPLTFVVSTEISQ